MSSTTAPGESKDRQVWRNGGVSQMRSGEVVGLDARLDREHAGASAFSETSGSDVSTYLPRLLEIVSDPSVLKRMEPAIELASGEMSHDFIDGKHAVDDPDDLDFVGSAMFAAASHADVEFDAVGGLVLGAVPFTFAVANASRKPWFLIRKEPKGRGTNLWIEGARLARGARVMLVDDVVTTGGSIQDAYEKVLEQGATVVFATTLVDRGDVASAFFEGEGVPYAPLLSYRDLKIEPVGRNRTPARAG